MNSTPPNRRLLLVDDNPSIHDDFRRILVTRETTDDLDAAAAALFGGPAVNPATAPASFELDSALQGQEARDLVVAAVAAGRPYALAFVDMRIPPGWDGLTTIGKLWEVDPDLQVIICTAYSDRSWEEIQAALPARDRWLVLKKPFDKIEVLQLAHALTEKWHLMRLARVQLATLDRMVGQRTQQLSHALQVKNEFLANVSHELLTPMNGIIGLLEVLDTPGLDPDQRGCLGEARACGEALLRMLQQILAFNQAEAGTLTLEPVDFSPHALLEEVLGIYRARANHKGLALHAEIPPGFAASLRAPAPVIRHILLALVDNAVKFTPRGTVTFGVHGEGDRLIFRVQDTGIGMTPEQLAWIALPFAQVDGGRKRTHSGIGLGLPLAQRLATSLGGELTLSAQPGGGTTATFSALLSAPTALLRAAV